MKFPTTATLAGLMLMLSLPGWAAPAIEASASSETSKKLLDPHHASWQKQPECSVQMLPQNIAIPNLKKPIFQELKVRGAISEGWLLLRLEWQDNTRDAEVTRGEFTDACAVELPIKGNAQDTSPFMGNPGKPVQLIHWKAIWQDDIEKGYRDVEHAYPNHYYDYYPLAKGKKAEDISGAALLWNPARRLKNPVSETRRSQPVEELIAEGFGSSTTQKQNDSKARGVHKEGRWSVVIARPLQTNDGSDAPLKKGSTVPVAFALWDGATGNRGARKHYAMWVDLKLGGGK